MATFITKRFTFDAAHRLPYHNGKCQSLHGHTYTVEVTIEGGVQGVHPNNPESGMVIDFSSLSDYWKKHIEPEMDHKVFLHKDDPLRDHVDPEHLATTAIYPTAELLAANIFGRLRMQFDVFRVRVYETPTSWAEVV